MKNKILLCVELPATKKIYDFWIPQSMQLCDAVPLLAKLIESKDGLFFTKSASNTFMLKGSGEIIDSNQTAKELGFLNGTQLMLV